MADVGLQRGSGNSDEKEVWGCKRLNFWDRSHKRKKEADPEFEPPIS